MLTHANDYFQRVLHIQQHVIETQQAALERAVDVFAASAAADGRIFIFGSGHSHLLAEEGHYRAGGLANVVPILTNKLMLHEGAVASTLVEREPGIAKPLFMQYLPTSNDCLLVISNSGVNAVPVEMALAARECGLKVVAMVARTYAEAATVGVAGYKLTEVADVIIDNGGVPGDAVVPIQTENDVIYSGPTSTVVGAFILNALLVETAARISAHTHRAPPVYISANMPGATAHNQALIDHMRPKNPHL